MTKTILFVPHYKASFKTLLSVALYARENNIGNPHFILYFDESSGVQHILDEQQMQYSLYTFKPYTHISFIDKIFKLFSDLRYSRQLVNRLSPVQAMVCVVESNNLEYALISVLNKRNINTIVLQWAQTIPSKSGYYSQRNKKKDIVSSICLKVKNILRRMAEGILGIKYAGSYGSGDAAFFAVMGEYYMDMFGKQGVPKNKLVLTGHPEHDTLYHLSIQMKSPDFKPAVLTSMNLDANKPLWIFAREAVNYFQLIGEDKDKQDIRTVLDILSRYHPDIQIVLKLHPRDKKEYYHFVLDQYPHIAVIEECDLYSLIAACDLYISQISSTMMWAIALGKPVISYDFNNQPHWEYFRNKEGIIKVNAPEALAEEIDRFVHCGTADGAERQYQAARNQYMKFDGNACRRIVELIQKNNIKTNHSTSAG